MSRLIPPSSSSVKTPITQVIEYFLIEQEESTWQLNKFILELLYFILTKIFFTFMNHLFLQTQGVTMGTCAPSYTNLYLGGWERAISF